MVVGGYAVAFHGYPRFTKGIDIFYDSGDTTRLRVALEEFGFGPEDIPIELFETPGNIVTFGVVPVRADLLNQIDGVTFAEAKPNLIEGMYGSVMVKFIGRADLLQNKRSTPRTEDKADVEELT